MSFLRKQESRGELRTPSVRTFAHYEALRAYIVLADLKGEDFTGGKITLYLGEAQEVLRE